MNTLVSLAKALISLSSTLPLLAGLAVVFSAVLGVRAAQFQYRKAKIEHQQAKLKASSPTTPSQTTPPPFSITVNPTFKQTVKNFTPPAPSPSLPRRFRDTPTSPHLTQRSGVKPRSNPLEPVSSSVRGVEDSKIPPNLDTNVLPASASMSETTILDQQVETKSISTQPQPILQDVNARPQPPSLEPTASPPIDSKAPDPSLDANMLNSTPQPSEESSQVPSATKPPITEWFATEEIVTVADAPPSKLQAIEDDILDSGEKTLSSNLNEPSSSIAGTNTDSQQHEPVPEVVSPIPLPNTRYRQEERRNLRRILRSVSFLVQDTERVLRKYQRPSTSTKLYQNLVRTRRLLMTYLQETDEIIGPLNTAMNRAALDWIGGDPRTVLFGFPDPLHPAMYPQGIPWTPTALRQAFRERLLQMVQTIEREGFEVQQRVYHDSREGYQHRRWVYIIPRVRDDVEEALDTEDVQDAFEGVGEISDFAEEDLDDQDGEDDLDDEVIVE